MSDSMPASKLGHAALTLIRDIRKRRIFQDNIEYFEAELIDGKLVLEDPATGGNGWVCEDLAGTKANTVIRWKQPHNCTMGTHYHGFGGTETLIVLNGWCKFHEREITLAEGDRLTIPAGDLHTVEFSDDFDSYLVFTPEHPIQIIRRKDAS